MTTAFEVVLLFALQPAACLMIRVPPVKPVKFSFNFLNIIFIMQLSLVFTALLAGSAFAAPANYQTDAKALARDVSDASTNAPAADNRAIAIKMLAAYVHSRGCGQKAAPAQPAPAPTGDVAQAPKAENDC